MRLKICFITPEINKRGGTERSFAELIEYFSKDNDVTVYANRAEDLNTSGFKFVKVPMIRKPGILKFFSFFFLNNLFLLFARRGEFDIIHSSGADSMFSNVNVYQFCQRMRKVLIKKGIIKFKVSSLKSFFRKLHYLLYATTVTWVEKITSKRKSLRIAVIISNSMHNELIGHYSMDPGKIVTIYNGVNLNEFNPTNKAVVKNEMRKKLSITNDETVYIFVGGDWERKGLSYALRAFGKLAKKDTKFLIVGHGDYVSFKNLCERLKISDKVLFTGPTDETCKYYLASDILVFPTLYEPFGLVAFEAMASGVPVIVSKTAGVSELIENGKEGILLDNPASIDEIRTAMELLYGDKEMREEVSREAMAKVKHYTWQRISKETHDAYLKAIDRL